MSTDFELDLTVQVNAAEWAYTQRRTVYLETLLFRLMRDEAAIQEWLTADDLASLDLPGLPPTAAGITRKASAGRWRRRRDRRGGRERYAYHVASLPARSFDTLMARLLNVEGIEADPLAPPATPAVPPLQARPEALTAPPWVLPLMRLIKSDGSLAAAWHKLPDNLPPGVALPTVQEAATVLLRFGLAD